jgi:hypothetical protein
MSCPLSNGRILREGYQYKSRNKTVRVTNAKPEAKAPGFEFP